MIPREEPPVRVLVVDDEPEVLRALVRVVERLTPHTTVECAASAEEALPLVERRAYDIVISDYQMGIMSGAQFLGRVQELNPRTIRVLVTAYRETHVAVEAINLGHVHGFVQKPWSVTELLDRLTDLLRLRHAELHRRRVFARTFSTAARTVIAGERHAAADS